MSTQNSFRPIVNPFVSPDDDLPPFYREETLSVEEQIEDSAERYRYWTSLDGISELIDILLIADPQTMEELLEPYAQYWVWRPDLGREIRNIAYPLLVANFHDWQRNPQDWPKGHRDLFFAIDCEADSLANL